MIKILNQENNTTMSAYVIVEIDITNPPPPLPPLQNARQFSQILNHGIGD